MGQRDSALCYQQPIAVLKLVILVQALPIHASYRGVPMFRMIGNDCANVILKKFSCLRALSASGGSQVRFA